MLPLSRSPLQDFFDAAPRESLPVREVLPLIPAPKVKPTQKRPSTHPFQSKQQDESDRILLQEMFASSYAAARNFGKASSFIAEIPDQYCNLKIRAWNTLIREAMNGNELEIALNALQQRDRLSKRAKLENPAFVRNQLVAIAKLYSECN